MISSKRRETLNDKHNLMLQKYLNKSPKKALVCESKPKQNLKFQDKLRFKSSINARQIKAKNQV